ncbi:hypothetical protein F4801DRAFT_474020 [Xylaria longipes]|nr:hypothetical protein F4801DRAFT_474020 [Xylaria longipes]
MAIHPQFWPQFWVLVRNYRLLEKDLLVQSPNVDLKARVPRIIIRTINGDYMGEPRILEAPTSLGDIDGTVYRHAAHGVYVSSEPHEHHFPLWVCLQGNEHCQESHIWVLDLFKFEFLMVPISKVCWVPTHEAVNGDLYTVISSPGKHGYAKEMYLPTVAQKIGLPEQARFKLPSSSLAGFTRLEPKRQEALFKKQYMSIQERCGMRSSIAARQLPWSRRGIQRRQFYTASDADLKNPEFLNDDSSSDESTSPLLQDRIQKLHEEPTEGFCRRCSCLFSDLGPTFLDPYPLHRHFTDDECNFGSSHRLHCIFAAHRPDHCVISGSREQHEHCVTYRTPVSLVDFVPTPIEHEGADVNATGDDTAVGTIEIDSDDEELEFGSLSDELETFSSEPYSNDNMMLDGQEIDPWSILAVPYPESRPISPVVEYLPNIEEDGLPDLVVDMAAVQSTIWNQPNIFMTPEPPEICR